MGIDLIWLLPIHPIGMTNRKGTLGSPYSIDDFRAVNPQYGTMDDFRRMVSEIHRLGMRIMIDIVFRHTSYDCPWVKEHPEWYARDELVKFFISFLIYYDHIYVIGESNCSCTCLDRYFGSEIGGK